VFSTSFNVDQFMQTFDSELIKNPVRIIVVVKCLILCSKFGKKLFVGRAEESGDGRAGWGVHDKGGGMGRGRGKGRGRKREGRVSPPKENPGYGPDITSLVFDL